MLPAGGRCCSGRLVYLVSYTYSKDGDKTESVLRGREWRSLTEGGWHVKLVMVGGVYWCCKGGVIQTLLPYPLGLMSSSAGGHGSPASPAPWPNTKGVSSLQPWSLSPVSQTFSVSPRVREGRLQVNVWLWLMAPPEGSSCPQCHKLRYR